MKYLLKTTEVYRVDSEAEAAQLIDDAKKESGYILGKYASQYKERKQKGEVIDIEDATHLLGITRNTYYPIEAEAFGATFIITSLDRLHNESKPVKVKL